MMAHKRVPRICEACGRDFLARLSDLKNPKKPNAGKTCSRRCRALLRWRSGRRGRDTPNQPGSGSCAPLKTP